MKRFFVDRANMKGDRFSLAGPDVRHMRTVLRLGPGDEVLLFDGQGMEYRARIAETTPRTVTLETLAAYRATSESPLEATLGQGFLKARKMDRIVRQLTELGIFAFIPFMAQRSVPKPKPGALAQRIGRWENIAREALKQCGRHNVPRVGPVLSFEELVSTDEPYDLKVIFHSPPSNETCRDPLNGQDEVKSILALVGPEGGFTDQEVGLALERGFVQVSLGHRVLRADTAAVAAGTILQHFFGDLRGFQKGVDNK
jgi:16S rRNA (uracil1498-N3)-methyltransferase